MGIKKKCREVLSFLQAQKIEYEEIDLAAAPNNRKQMLAKMPETKQTPPVLPPQVFSDMTYLGDYDAFFEAREQELPFTWLKLTPPVGSREEQMVSGAFSHLLHFSF